jgi:hypothetical protein
MLSDDDIYRQHHRDMRASLPRGSTRTSAESITPALLSHLPFPDGVIPKCVLKQFLRLPDIFLANNRISYAWANGPAIDSLVILFRLILALSLTGDSKEHGEPLLYELAFHDFGRDIRDDYIIKGKFFETLFPHEDGTGRIDATLGELIRHPLVNSSLWAHPSLQFFRRHTWAKKPNSPQFEPYNLDPHNPALKPHPFPFEYEGSSGPPNLRRYFSRILGLHTLQDTTTTTTPLTAALACRMPPVLPVILKGGHQLRRLRAFLLEGPVDHRLQPDGTLRPVVKKRPYHLRAVVNLADSDIRLYHQDTTPVVERVRPAGEEDRPADYYAAKLLRGGQARGWRFEESPLQYFMLVYGKYMDPEGRPYQAPSEAFGEVVEG